jgi:hypothetical protein
LNRRDGIPTEGSVHQQDVALVVETNRVAEVEEHVHVIFERRHCKDILVFDGYVQCWALFPDEARRRLERLHSSSQIPGQGKMQMASITPIGLTVSFRILWHTLKILGEVLAHPLAIRLYDQASRDLTTSEINSI